MWTIDLTLQELDNANMWCMYSEMKRNLTRCLWSLKTNSYAHISTKQEKKNQNHKTEQKQNYAPWLVTGTSSYRMAVI